MGLPATEVRSKANGRKNTVCQATTNCAEKRLLDSALTLFSENGYDGTSIREIIERAGVTRPVLYYYFKNKEDLFLRLVQSSFTEFNASIDDITSRISGCRERLKALMRMGFEQTERSPGIVRLILQAFFSGPMGKVFPETHAMVESRFERIVGIVQDGLDSGELAGGDPEVLAFVFAGIMDMHDMARAYMEEGRLTPELADALVEIFMDGARCPAPSVREVRSPFAAVRCQGTVCQAATNCGGSQA